VSASPLSESQLADVRRRADDSLYFFIKGILGYDWLTPEVHLPLTLQLQDRSVTRQRVVLPRGWLKTTICSIGSPIHAVTKNHSLRFLLAQNTHTNALKKLSEIKSVIETNELFRAVYPDLRPSKTLWRQDALCVERTSHAPEATFECAGVRTQITSRHYDEIIEDDTVAPDYNELGENALTPTKEDIEMAIGWHRLVMPLLVNPKTSRNIIVGTRWFEKDLISWNAENEPSFVAYERAVRETDGQPDENGRIVYPQRFDAEVLAQLAASMGPYLFSCLYMNKPMRSKDMVFQLDWFSYYDTEPRDLITYTTVDLSGDPEDSKGTPDFNVVMTCGKDLTRGNIYVLDYWRGRCNPSEVIDQVFRHVRKWHPVKVGVEAVAYQRSMCYWIKERMRKDGSYFFVEPITPGRTHKNQRIQQLQPLVHAGVLKFRHHHQELVSELLSFPLAKNDDLGDTLAMQLPMWAQTHSAEEARRMEANDPFTLEGLIDELRSRTKGLTKGLVFDVLGV
jgi:predicted phage terminase large subunit-like protein